MTSKPFFSVFTPTYNRAATLPRVYASLNDQSFRDFEWVVVDDGSTDDTETLVTHWAGEAPFPVRYFKQRQSHKKTAFNHGVREAKGRLFLVVDSDDALLPNALETFHDCWATIPVEERNRFAGMRALSAPAGRTVRQKFPVDVVDGNWLEMLYKEGMFSAETVSCARTDLLRPIPYPEDVEGHVPEGVVWSRLAQKHQTRMVNRLVLNYFDSADSLTRSGHFMNGPIHAEGQALWAAQVLSDELRWFRYQPWWFARIAANYVRFQLHIRRDKRRNRLKGLLTHLWVLLMTPIGYSLFLRDKVASALTRRKEGV